MIAQNINAFETTASSFGFENTGAFGLSIALDRHRPHLDRDGARARHRSPRPATCWSTPARSTTRRSRARRARSPSRSRTRLGFLGYATKAVGFLANKGIANDTDRPRAATARTVQIGVAATIANSVNLAEASIGDGADGHGRRRRHRGQGAGRGQPPDQRLGQRQRRQHARRGRRRDVHRPRQRGQRVHRRRRRRRDGHDARARQRARPEPDHRLLRRASGAPTTTRPTTARITLDDDPDSQQDADRVKEEYDDATDSFDVVTLGLDLFFLVHRRPAPSSATASRPRSSTPAARPTATRTRSGIAGGVNLYDLQNASNAWIAPGAEVNQDLTGADPGRRSSRRFAVVETVDVAGQFTAARQSPTSAPAPSRARSHSAARSSSSTRTTAPRRVDRRRRHASPPAATSTVNADAFTWALVVTQSGGKANKFALDGSINFYDARRRRPGLDRGRGRGRGGRRRHGVRRQPGDHVRRQPRRSSPRRRSASASSISVTDISNTVHAFIGDGNGSGRPGRLRHRGRHRSSVLANDPDRIGPNVTSWAISMSGVTDAGEVKDKSKGEGLTGSGSANSGLRHAEPTRTRASSASASPATSAINYIVEDIKAYIAGGVPVDDGRRPTDPVTDPSRRHAARRCWSAASARSPPTTTAASPAPSRSTRSPRT